MRDPPVRQCGKPLPYCVSPPARSSVVNSAPFHQMSLLLLPRVYTFLSSSSRCNPLTDLVKGYPDEPTPRSPKPRVVTRVVSIFPRLSLREIAYPMVPRIRRYQRGRSVAVSAVDRLLYLLKVLPFLTAEASARRTAEVMLAEARCRPFEPCTSVVRVRYPVMIE